MACENSTKALIKWVHPDETAQFLSNHPPISWTTNLIETRYQCPIQYNLYALFGKKTAFAGTYIDSLDSRYPVVHTNNHRGTFWGPIYEVRLADYKTYGYPGYLSYEILCHGRTNTARKTTPTAVKTNVLSTGTSSALVSVIGWDAITLNNQPDNCGQIRCLLEISDSRGKVFEKEFLNSCPEITVICNDEQCPDGTCSIECNDHICCYDANGNNVKTITKF